MMQVDAVADLVDRARGGDRHAWDALVEAFLPLVLSVIARHRLPAADADDVNQTVWLRLVEHLRDLRDSRALAGWISTTTRHECLRSLARSRRTVAVDPQATSAWDARNAEGDLEEDLLVVERQSVVRRALQELSPERRRLLLLLVADPPVPYQEISRRLGIPVGSIGPTRARALAQLRRAAALRDYDRDDRSPT